jgi:hypothetical protein
MNSEGHGKKRLWIILRYCSIISLKWPRKISNVLRISSRQAESEVRNVSEYEEEALTNISLLTDKPWSSNTERISLLVK